MLRPDLEGVLNFARTSTPLKQGVNESRFRLLESALASKELCRVVLWRCRVVLDSESGRCQNRVTITPSKQSDAAPVERSERFTATHWSVVLTAGEAASPKASEALEKLCRTYWPPLYAYVRRQGHGPHDAQDLTQEFFARLLARNHLGNVGPGKGKFRSFLLAAMNHFLADERDRAHTAKRGGGAALFSLDDEDAENLYLAAAATDVSPDKIFEKRWAATLLGEAFAKLQQESVTHGKADRFERLKVFLEDGTCSGDYEAAGEELGVSANTVAAAVHRLRQRYRELVQAEIANTVAGPNDVKEEMRDLFAALAG